MKKRIVALLMALCLLVGLAPTIVATEMHYETVIIPQYEEVGRFNDGYAPVKADGKWGYINKTGEIVVEPKYDWAGISNEGVAVTLIAGEYYSNYDERRYSCYNAY